MLQRSFWVSSQLKLKLLENSVYRFPPISPGALQPRMGPGQGAPRISQTLSGNRSYKNTNPAVLLPCKARRPPIPLVSSGSLSLLLTLHSGQGTCSESRTMKSPSSSLQLPPQGPHPQQGQPLGITTKRCFFCALGILQWRYL